MSVMKKVIIYSSITLLTLVVVGAMVVVGSVHHVRLPHGAMLHVLPGLLDSHDCSAVILCPGGGYSYLEKWREGYCWFPFFYLRGYVPAMLEYRMPKGHCTIPETDASEAVLMMRKHAGEWHFNRNDIGIAGFSAGGHLASTMMVTADDAARPDFGILLYALISMRKEYTHMDSHDQLLGKDASEELEAQYSSELHVSEKTSAAYIAIAYDDDAVCPQMSLRFHDEMRARKRPVSLHVYPSGGHGWVSRFMSAYRSQALDDLSEWLRNRKATAN